MPTQARPSNTAICLKLDAIHFCPRVVMNKITVVDYFSYYRFAGFIAISSNSEKP